MTSSPHSHLTRPPHKEPPAHAPNAALLIDFDNVTMGIRSDLQTELKRLLQSEIIRGKVAVQRAYADWRRYPQYIVPLSESSIDLIFAPAYGSSKKNATDIRLAIDALEIVFTRPEIGTFILLSGDSDFSSLVLKLKEYGKYVIGVGIRESSSDLLIQNCDEYFSYNELTGLTKASDIAYERRDPWQLVVEAVKQMTAHNDVMRSDRLKQVMQELDPNFDEKDVGFSRFSKFVIEAAKRGLLMLSRLDNGQYEIALGPEAGGAPRATADALPAGGEGKRSRSGRAPAGGRRSAFSLSEAFGLLKQALGRTGTNEAVDADQLREAMVELKGESGESLSESRFPKLLRQAHDAEIIDLSKDDGGYQVRLRPGAEAGPVEEPPARRGDARGTRREAEAPAGAARDASGDRAVVTPAEPQAAARRNPRFRRGSRGRPPAPAASPGPSAAPAAQAPAERGPPEERARPAASEERPDGERSDRNVRGRRGSRGRGRGGAERRGEAGSERRGEPGSERRGEPGSERRGEPASERRGGERPGRAERGAGVAGSEERSRGADGDGPRRRRRGGRGRGGRGSREAASGADDGGTELPPAPPPSTRAASPPETDGASFWSRVKRGLIGE